MPRLGRNKVLFILAQGFDAFGAGRNALAGKWPEFFAADLLGIFGHLKPLQVGVFSHLGSGIIFAS